MVRHRGGGGRDAISLEAWPERCPGHACAFSTLFPCMSMASSPLSPAATSFLNRTEATNVEKLVTRFLQCGVTPAQIGVVTPYEGQRAHVVSVLLRQGTLRQDLYKVGAEEERAGAEEGKRDRGTCRECAVDAGPTLKMTSLVEAGPVEGGACQWAGEHFYTTIIPRLYHCQIRPTMHPGCVPGRKPCRHTYLHTHMHRTAHPRQYWPRPS